MMRQKEKTKLDLRSGNSDHGGFVVTGRSLFLNRHTYVSIAGERAGTEDLCDWKDDTYVGLLKLTPSMIENMRGKTILDIGVGCGFFAAEAQIILGAQVVAGDIDAENICKTNLAGLHNAYQKSMRKLSQKLEPEPEAAIGLSSKPKLNISLRDKGNYSRYIQALIKYQAHILEAHEEIIRNMQYLDATDMAGLRSNNFDYCLSVWMLAYLKPAVQKKVIEEMVRVTRIGGTIILYPGKSPYKYTRQTFTNQFYSNARQRFMSGKSSYVYSRFDNQYVIHNKQVTIENFEYNDDRIVLKVSRYDPYYMYSLHDTVFSCCRRKWKQD